MALYLRSQFADHCGIKRAYVTTYVGRGKIIMRGEYIDTDIRENREFMEQQLEKKAAKEAEAEAEASKTPPLENSKPLTLSDEKATTQKGKTVKAADTKTVKALKAKKPVNTKTEDLVVPKANSKRVKAVEVPEAEEVGIESGMSIAQIDKAKKQAEILLKESQTRISLLKEQKMRGESIPTDMVADLVSMLGRSFQSSYKNGAFILLMEVSQKTKMSPEVEAEAKGLLVELINKSHSNAIKEAKIGIKNILAEVSDNFEDVEEEEKTK